MPKCVTYQASNGESIHISPEQKQRLRNAGIWPRNSFGEEYHTVYHGLHYVMEEDPNRLTDDDLEEMLKERGVYDV